MNRDQMIVRTVPEQVSGTRYNQYPRTKRLCLAGDPVPYIAARAHLALNAPDGFVCIVKHRGPRGGWGSGANRMTWTSDLAHVLGKAQWEYYLAMEV